MTKIPTNDNSNNQHQLPDGRWVPAQEIKFQSLWTKLLCKVGIHRLAGAAAPYVMQCTRCDKTEYVGL